MKDEFDSPAARVLGVLTWFSTHPGRSVSDMSRATGLTKSTAHRIVEELQRLGWLSPAPGKKGPVIGPRGMEMASAALAERLSTLASSSILQDLSNKLGETCTLALQEGTEVRFIENVSPQGSFAYIFPMRERSPLFCSSSGRVFLADWPQTAVEQYLHNTPREAYTPDTVTDSDALKAIIDEVRKSGYAWTWQQWVPDVIGAAVPIRDRRGRCVAALSFNAPDHRVRPDDISKIIPEMRMAADRLSREFST